MLPFFGMGTERTQICDGCGARLVEREPGMHGLRASMVPDPASEEARWGHIGNFFCSFDLCPGCLAKAYTAVGVSPPTAEQMMGSAHSPLYGMPNSYIGNGQRHLRPVPMPTMSSTDVPLPVIHEIFGGAPTPAPQEPRGLSPEDLRELKNRGHLTDDDLRRMGIDPDPLSD